MDWSVLIVVGVIGAIVLVVIAMRGSFKDDDAFYNGSTLGSAGVPTDDHGHGQGHDAGDGGSSSGGGDAGGGGGGGDGGGGSSGGS